MSTTPPLTLTKAATLGADIAVIGDATRLKVAFEAGTQITLDGKLAGERVYLGYLHQVMGDGDVTVERVGLDRMIGEVAKFPGHTIAAYCVDLSRLDDAPTLAAKVSETNGQQMRSYLQREARAEAKEQHLTREAD
jgi:hypothetical protein